MQDTGVASEERGRAYNNTPTQNKQAQDNSAAPYISSYSGLDLVIRKQREPPRTWSWTTSISKTETTASRAKAHHSRALRLSSYE